MEGWHDYTVATPLERFTATVEQTIRSWYLTGLDGIVRKAFQKQLREQPALVKVQAALTHKLPWRRENYILQLHLPTTGHSALPATRTSRSQTDTRLADGQNHVATGSQQQQQQQQQATPTTSVDRTSREAQHQAEGAYEEGASAGWEVGVELDISALLDSLQHSTEYGGSAMGPGADSEVQQPTAQQPEQQRSELDEAAGADAQPPTAQQQACALHEAVDIEVQQLTQQQRLTTQRQQACVPVEPADEHEQGTELAAADSALAAGTDALRQQPQTESQPAPQPASGGAVTAESKLSTQDNTDLAIQPDPSHATHVAAPATPTRSAPKHAASANDQLPTPSAVTSDSDSQHAVETAVLVSTPTPNTHGSTPASTPAEASAAARQGSERLLSLWWPRAPVSHPWWQHLRQHKLQRWWGLDHFLLLQPHSFSKRILDESEAATLLGACAAALSHTSLSWPLLLPVHDVLRDAYWGALALPQAGCRLHLTTDSLHTSSVNMELTTVQGQLRVFSQQLLPHSPPAATACGEAAEALQQMQAGGDDLGGSRVSVRLSACFTYRLPHLRGDPPGTASAAEIARTVSRRSSRISEDDDGLGSVASELPDGHSPASWDAGAPWQPWAVQQDPVGCLELDCVWEELALGHRGVSEEQLLQPGAACHWLLHALRTGSEAQGYRLGLQPRERCRRHVELHAAGPDSLNPQPLGPGSFSVMLRGLMHSRAAMCQADSLGALMQAELWEAAGRVAPPLPPLGVRTAVLHDLLPLAPLTPQPSADFTALPAQPLSPAASGSAPALRLPTNLDAASGGPAPVEPSGSSPAQRCASAPHGNVETPCHVDTQAAALTADGQAHASSPPSPQPHSTAPHAQQESSSGVDASGSVLNLSYPGTTPLGSLLSRLALHCLVWNNARAIALLWHSFTTRLRMKYWEAGRQLPLASASATATTAGAPGSATAAATASAAEPPAPDLQCSLLHQKLQLLDVCIHRSRLRQQQQQSQAHSRASTPHTPLSPDGTPPALPEDSGYFSASEDEDFVQGRPRGAGAEVGGLRLARHPSRPLRAPLTSPPPVYSQDRLAEKQAALRALQQLSVDPAGAEAALRLSSEQLCSDMAAFKAANPGAVLQDFLAWRQATSGAADLQSSLFQPPVASAPHSTASQAGPLPDVSMHAFPSDSELANLWSTTAACPVWEQKPVQDPALEGERTLHDLETLQPADLMVCLLGCSLAASVQLLGRSEGAQLPPVAQLLVQYHRLSAGIIERGMQYTGSTSGPLLRGWDDAELEFLLSEFYYLEQAVVTAESLVRRLPGCRLLACDLMTALLQGETRLEGRPLYVPIAWVDDLVARQQLAACLSRPHSQALGSHTHSEQQGSSGHEGASGGSSQQPHRTNAGGNTTLQYAYGCEKAQRRMSAGQLDVPNEQSQSQSTHALVDHDTWCETLDSDGCQQVAALALGWDPPIQREWVLECSEQEVAGTTQAAPLLTHRMYTQVAEGEMRLAFRLVTS